VFTITDAGFVHNGAVVKNKVKKSTWGFI